MLDSVDLPALIETFDAEITASPDSYFGTELDLYMVTADLPHVNALFAWALTKLAADQLEFDEIDSLLVTAFCAESTQHSALDWFRGLPDDHKSDAFDAMFGGFNEYGPKLSEHGIELHESSYEYFVRACVPDELVQLAWSAIDDEPARQLAILHGLWHSGHPGALSRIEQALDAGDSEMRKGAVVLLARHEASAPNYDIDDAFRGSAPRLVLFRFERQYRGSVALQRYEALSGHDYGNVGKRFPPVFGSAAYADNDATAWRAFLDEFPWYMSSDDAYYRLAYEYFLDGDLAGARSVIAEYRSRTYIDADASPYINQLDALIQLVGRASPRAVARASLEPILHAPWLDDYESVAQSVENAALIVDLLYVFGDAASTAGVMEAELIAARKALDFERTKCERDCAIPEAYLFVHRKLVHTPTNDPIVHLARRIYP